MTEGKTQEKISISDVSIRFMKWFNDTTRNNKSLIIFVFGVLLMILSFSIVMYLPDGTPPPYSKNEKLLSNLAIMSFIFGYFLQIFVSTLYSFKRKCANCGEIIK